jgi:hypothetical protein
LSPQSDLGAGLFPGDIENRLTAGSQIAGYLEQQGGLTGAWLPAYQNGTAGDYAAAQNPIQLSQPCRLAVLRKDVKL